MVKNHRAIDCLKLADFYVLPENPSPYLQSVPEKKAILFLLADGQLSYCSFPKITVPEQLLMESKIVDF
jgi:hypothetical protein